MHIALLLHIYQPPTQYPFMTRKIADESYKRIIGLLLKYPEAKISLNINASLTEQLARESFKDLLGNMARLAENGQLEFTGSAAYHPILTELPKREIFRQIKQNNKINQSYFGSAYQPRGFFPPELAFNSKVGEVVEGLGFEWIVVDSTAVSGNDDKLKFVYKIKDGNLLVFPREDSISYRIAFGRIKTRLGFVRAIGAKELEKKQYIVMAMDGETFGHHQKKQLKFLEALFKANEDDKRINLVRISDLMRIYNKRRSVELLTSTWGYTEEVGGRKEWVRWWHPKNPVHMVLVKLRRLALRVVKIKDKKARLILDKALNSDTFWWASGKPFWHPGMVKKGAKLFYESVRLSSASKKEKGRAKYLAGEALERQLKRMRTRVQRGKIL